MEPLAITEVGLCIPEPAGPAFVALVRSLVREADRNARREMPPGRRRRRKPARTPRAPRPTWPSGRTGRCKGCACQYDATTPGCKSCTGRHKGRGYHPTVKTTCVQCGCPLDNRTPGCHACESRHWMRGRAARRREAVRPPN